MADTVRVTTADAYVKVSANTEAQDVTSVRAYVKYRAFTNDLRATQVAAYVKVARPWPEEVCKPTAHYTYNGVDISSYCNAIDLQNMPRDLPKRTLGDTGAKAVAGLGEYSVRLKGDWDSTIDALLGVDALNGTQRTGVAAFDDCSMTVTYAFAAAMVKDWRVITQANNKIEWNATLRHNSLGVRTVAASS